MRGNANGLEDAGGGPGKSYLFLLTAVHGARARPRNRFTRRWGGNAGKARGFSACPVRRRRSVKIQAPGSWLETSVSFAPPGVLITASGLQGV